ncbi:MAG: hypothetical protein M0C28_00595 [Candidatus Moduliflexus flocculans]|nr:hypothetical protein [Candidatus Moduliflexus flocculans]
MDRDDLRLRHPVVPRRDLLPAADGQRRALESRPGSSSRRTRPARRWSSTIPCPSSRASRRPATAPRSTSPSRRRTPTRTSRRPRFWSGRGSGVSCSRPTGSPIPGRSRSSSRSSSPPGRRTRSR